MLRARPLLHLRSATPHGQSVIPEQEEDLAFTDGDGEEGAVEPTTIRNSTNTFLVASHSISEMIQS